MADFENLKAANDGDAALATRGNHLGLLVLSRPEPARGTQPVKTDVTAADLVGEPPKTDLIAGANLSVYTKAALRKLDSAIEDRQRLKGRETYLDQVTDLFATKENESFAKLEELKKDTTEALKKGDVSYVEKRSADIHQAAADERVEWQNKQDSHLNYYGSMALQGASLLLGGKKGWALAMTTFALGEARPGDNLSNQLKSGAIGAMEGAIGKGAATVALHSTRELGAEGIKTLRAIGSYWAK